MRNGRNTPTRVRLPGHISGAGPSHTDPRDDPTRVLAERILHGRPRDFLAWLRNEKAIVDRQVDRQDDDALGRDS